MEMNIIRLQEKKLPYDIKSLRGEKRRGNPCISRLPKKSMVVGLLNTWIAASWYASLALLAMTEQVARCVNLSYSLFSL